MEISKVNLIFSMDEMDRKGKINVLEVGEVLGLISRKLPAEQVLVAAHSGAKQRRQLQSVEHPSRDHQRPEVWAAWWAAWWAECGAQLLVCLVDD